MSEQPLLSVIVPIYNAERYLGQCLESILGQTLRNLELICVNDGSLDNSRQILEDAARKDPRIRIIDTENKGAASARNSGIRMAIGEYVSFLDSDDWLASDDIYEKMYQSARARGVDILFGQIARFYEDEGRFVIEGTQPRCEPASEVYSLSDLNLYELSRNPSNKFFKRRLLESPSVRFPEDLVYDDASIFLFQSFIRAQRISHVPDIVYNYRIRRKGRGSITTTVSDDFVLAAIETTGSRVRGILAGHDLLGKYNAMNFIKLLSRLDMLIKRSQNHHFTYLHFRAAVGDYQLAHKDMDQLSCHEKLLRKIVLWSPWYLLFKPLYAIHLRLPRFCPAIKAAVHPAIR